MPGADWLMVIDLQPAFSHPDSPWFTPGLDAISRRIAELLPSTTASSSPASSLPKPPLAAGSRTTKSGPSP